MINISHLYAGYSDPVLKGIDLHVNRGTITTIIGTNGCGKSTLLKCIARQLAPTSGDITLCGQPISSYNIKEFAKKISYLKQTRDLPTIGVASFVLHGRFPHMNFLRRLTQADKDIALSALKRANVWELRHKMLHELSGGECQKVYIAMALAQNADVLLLDEPTSNLDIKYILELLDLLKVLKNEGKTIVLVLHDINNALELSDNICVINDGRSEFFGAPSELIQTDVISRVFGVDTTTFECDGKPIVTFKNPVSQ